MSEIFFTSDTHFWHRNIITHCNRPFFGEDGPDVDEMNETLITNWNSRVKKGDRVYFLGDFSMGPALKTKATIERLKGQIHVVRGNHDEDLDRFKDKFASFNSYKELKVGSQHIVMSHYPMLTWNRAHYGAWMLHGHSHGTLKPTTLPRLDVGVDPNNMQLLHYDEVLAVMRDRSYEPVDHHVPES